jgi:predicted O-methyltransferase YrrM
MDASSSSEQAAPSTTEQPPPADWRWNLYNGPLPVMDYRAPRPDWRAIASIAVNDHRAIQHTAELAALLSMAEVAQVRTVLEIGTYAGGTAWAFAQLPTVTRVITVDADPQPTAAVTLNQTDGKAVLVNGHSAASATRHEVVRLLNGTPPDLLFIDAAHDLGSVTDDWQIYGPMVRPGGLVAFHDVEEHRGRPEVEVHHLWQRVRKAYPSVKITAAPGEWAGIGIIWR